jgi:CubicO group peptidase (beta-lactamase class C family)
MRHLLLLLVLVCTGLDAQNFDGMDAALARGDFGRVKAVIVSRNGQALFENYYRGSRADDLHMVQSVTKTVGSTLVGIAHRNGLIRLDQDLEHFFGGLYDMSQGALADKRAITVGQVLSQRHGLEWDEESTDYRDARNSANQMLFSSDWYRYTLTRPLATVPGQDFRYSTGASILMSRMIRAATGMGPEPYAQQALFEPLGIEAWHWEGYSEQGMGHGMTDWPNPDNDPPLGFGLWLRARDMVKLGQLYLDDGMYGGQRLLDPSWIDAAWARHSHAGNSTYTSSRDWGHGYQWWMSRFEDLQGRNWYVYFASGWGSQVIFLMPELDLVVVTVADNYDHAGTDVDALLINHVLPALNPVMDSRYNGSWFNPATSGQGFSVEVLDARAEIVSYWYTYTEDGAKRWFILQGTIEDGEGEVVVYETEGGVFMQNDPVEVIEWGTGRFRPVYCNHLEVTIESGEISETIPLTRLSGECFTPPGW